ncbi:hypothetical protein LEMLEM_LOCUS15469 [Lemmus lemmus]
MRKTQRTQNKTEKASQLPNPASLGPEQRMERKLKTMKKSTLLYIRYNTSSSKPFKHVARKNVVN